ncbi:hypothetical protein D9C73_026645 [Collichthys lucidus]|uniref:Uncharacterized protein n=1 Tax=Collichthys lucidus TaxID=240159 RepID=A0A4U5VWX2_COLLU|nr:hypothetical protein D9C73_026645 [Collichthys lucidus]
MYHLKNGSSPISVFSTISGSLPLHTLFLFIIFDLIQMYGVSPRPTDSDIALTKQKIETSDLRQSLLSRLKETEGEIEKCDEDLQSVEDELDKGATNCDELIQTNKASQREQQRLMDAQKSKEMKKTESELKKKHKDMVKTLKSQKDQMNALKNQVKKQVEDNKKKFNSVVKDEIVQKEYLDLRNVTSEYQKDLNRTLSELETLVLDVQKLLQSTQNTDGIKEAENHMDEEKTI